MEKLYAIFYRERDTRSNRHANHMNRKAAIRAGVPGASQQPDLDPTLYRIEDDWDNSPKLLFTEEEAKQRVEELDDPMWEHFIIEVSETPCPGKRVWWGEVEKGISFNRYPVFADGIRVGTFMSHTVLQAQYGSYFILNEYGISLGIDAKGVHYGWDSSTRTATAIKATYREIHNGTLAPTANLPEAMLDRIVGE